MSKTHTIKHNNIVYPDPRIDISIIFKPKSDNAKHDNTLLYQDILRYAVEHQYDSGYRFIELVNWLLDHNREFLEYYTDSNAHTPKNARRANRSHRVQACVDILIKLGLIKITSTVRAEKNDIDIPLYDFTMEGYLLAWLLNIKTGNQKNPDEKKSDSIHHVMEIIKLCVRINGSCNIIFVTKFFEKCIEKNQFAWIVSFFMDNIFPRYDLATKRFFGFVSGSS
jgi:hypothetical protein